MEEKVKESYWLRVPSDEHHVLVFKVDVIKKEDETKWIRMKAIANGEKTIAWSELEREK